MLVVLRPEQLRIGMFVVLPRRWTDHPFLLNQFVVKNEGVLRKLRNCGLGEVMVDPSRSVVRVYAPTCEKPKDDNPLALTCERLTRLQQDPYLAPEQKASAIYAESLQVIQQVCEKPSTESIAKSKKGIGSIVDAIMDDDECAEYLVRMAQHDANTCTHSVNVGVFGISLSKRLFPGRPPEEMRELGAAFFLHDLGKVTVDREVINKPGKLSPAELALMRTHPYESYRILEESGHLTEECRVIALQHHERENGGGYPCGLRGNDIHDYARVCSIADVFEALTSKRSYKKAMPPFMALEVMRDEMIHHFHREMFQQFVLLFAGKQRHAA